MTNLKGYITNTDIDAERVIAEYHGLWVWNVLSLNITDYGCGTCFQNFKRDIGNVPHVSLYRKKD